MSVAAATAEAGHDVELLDLMFVLNIERRIRKTLSAHYDVIGFSIRNLDTCSFVKPYCYAEEVLKVVNCVRYYSDAVMVAGGSGYSIRAPFLA